MIIDFSNSATNSDMGLSVDFISCVESFLYFMREISRTKSVLSANA